MKNPSGENPGIESFPISCLSQGAFINDVQIYGVHEIQTSVKRNIVIKIRTSGAQKAPIAPVLPTPLRRNMQPKLIQRHG